MWVTWKIHACLIFTIHQVKTVSTSTFSLEPAVAWPLLSLEWKLISLFILLSDILLSDFFPYIAAASIIISLFYCSVEVILMMICRELSYTTHTNSVIVWSDHLAQICMTLGFSIHIHFHLLTVVVC